MAYFINLLSNLFETGIASALGAEHSAQITPSTQERFGHYQCNSAMKLAKELGKNPREIATSIVEAVKAQEKAAFIIESLEIAGPGFINITLKSAYLSAYADKLYSDPRIGIPEPKKPKTICIDFSSPNVAKQLHVAHLRSTIIGDSLSRLFEFLGHKVIRLNHIGDWGTPFGMLIAYLKMHHPDVLEDPKKATLDDLQHWYKEARKLFENDEAFKSKTSDELVALQSKEPSAMHAWQVICTISRTAFEEIYKLLDVNIVERGESFYDPMLPEVVADLESKNMIEVSDGAKCVFVEGFEGRDGKPLPLIVQKSDGGYNYATTDLAAMRHRTHTEKADRIIVVVDCGQALHFDMVSTAARKAGFLGDNDFHHVGFGLVLGEDGKKIKTRSGEPVKLIDLIHEAIARAKSAIESRRSDLSSQELEELSQVLGIDALKYADLSSHRQRDYTFSFDRMLQFEGNTAAFLLYAYVRTGSIIEKAEDFDKSAPIELKHPSEVALALHLSRFDAAIEEMERDLVPHRLTDYLYELADKFNAFFRDCRTLGDPLQNSRLKLCSLTRSALDQGLSILGLRKVKKM